MNNIELEKSTEIEDLKLETINISDKKNENEQDWKIELISYTDPYCTWCWGSEPILRKIKAIYGDQVKISFIMGGLVENIDTFYDLHNNIGGPRKFEQGAAHWEEASGRHGQPVDNQLIFDLKKDFHSTYPASIAFKAAQMQDQKLADKLLRRMREATSAEKKLIHKIEVQVELAEEVGLNSEKFIRDIKSGEAEKKFLEDLKLTRSFGIHGFPTFQVKNREGKEQFLNGWQNYQTFERVFQKLTDNSLKKESYYLKEEDVLRFIKKFKKVSTKEIAVLFDIDRYTAYKYLNKMETIRKIEAGNDNFWVLK